MKLSRREWQAAHCWICASADPTTSAVSPCSVTPGHRPASYPSGASAQATCASPGPWQASHPTPISAISGA